MSAAGASDAEGKGRQLRDAIEREYQRLCAYVATLVRHFEASTRYDRVAERVVEVVAETVVRALARAEAFDPRQSAFHWLAGFAHNVLRESGRGRQAKQVKQTDLGDAKWAAALASLIAPGPAPEGADAGLRRRVRRAMAALRAEDRRILELAYVGGLDSASLASAVGVANAGAARARLCRAGQALKAAFAREPDVDDDDDDNGGGGEEQRT